MAIQRDVADICAQSVATHNFMVLCALYLKALAVSYGLATGRLAIHLKPQAPNMGDKHGHC
ncbi:hypothetical protein BO85DRAFT_451210 [Aspergillus piperis CBS 112811]|uniref:Uncharacterized protein n=1 Tax=Aspergillus piperis CBS 112811 TaxID=1448313 RepID=A0A8G1QZZ9_9EURO|nr:hypothetical protein BO85DRAFT_451210 [Aspergillus piperis CBS 112811]RAH55992.1 hypothetical protein BO85DRAFT_451210 [Aspergillus piperis CBS 112811]